MNKILLDTEDIENINITEDSVYELKNDIKNFSINFNIKNNAKLYLIEETSDEKNTLINVKQHNNSSFIFKSRIRCKKFYKLNINVELLGDNSRNVIDIHGLSDCGNIQIELNGTIKDNTVENYLDESVKILTMNNGSARVLPNMFVSSKEVIANHGVSISKLNEDELFYLNSKGIDYNNSKELLINGFLNID